MDQNRSNVESSGSASPDGVDTTLSHDKTTVEIPEIEEHAASEVRDSGSTLLRSPLDDNINTTSSSGYNTASGSRRGSNNTQPQPPAIQLPPMNTLPSHPLALYQGTAGQQSSVTFSYAPTHVYGAPVLPTYASVGYGPQQPQQPQQVGQVPQAYSQVPMATSPLTFGTRTLPYPFPVTMAGGYHYAQSSSDASYQQPISIPSVIPSYHQKFHNDIIPIQSMPIGTSLEPNLSTVENMGHEEIARPTSTQSAGAPMKPLSRINTARPNSSIGVAIERMPIGDLHLSAITPGTATDINMQLGTPTAGTSTPPDLMLESAAPSTAMVSSSRRDSRSRRATISSVTPNDESATASSLSIASTISGMSTSGQRLSKREFHRDVERRRRQTINDAIARLANMLPAQYQTAVNTGPDQIAQSTTPTKADQLERVAEYVEALREENKQLHAKIAELESAHAVGDKRTRQQ